MSTETLHNKSIQGFIDIKSRNRKAITSVILWTIIIDSSAEWQTCMQRVSDMKER
jgi:hypothetical protein